MTNLIGLSLGRYQILEQLGEGGMATVYKAYDTHLETEVAVKVIRTEKFSPEAVSRALKRFEREAKALARLTHPNIVKVIDYGEYEGQPYLVMPFLPGGNLKERLNQNGPMPWQEAARILLPIAQALDFAHSQNIIHRDVKPSNILLTKNNQPMLTDFGVAKVVEQEATVDLTGTAMAVGTPEYMAPEQATSKSIDHRVDIYALGIVFYEMITGRKPYVADTPLAVLFKQASEPLPRPKQFVPTLPDKVEQIILKALSKKPEDRYQTMGEFAGALERCLAEATVDQRQNKSGQAMAKPAREAVVPARIEKAHLKQETPPIVTQPPGTSTSEEPLKLQPETVVRGISSKRMVFISGVVVLTSILCVGSVVLSVIVSSNGNRLTSYAPPTTTFTSTLTQTYIPTLLPTHTPALTNTSEPLGPPKWYIQNSGIKKSLKAILFINLSYGWAVSGNTDSGIFHSQDGGNTWVEQNSPTQLSLESISFINRYTGFISGGNYFVDRTSKGVILKTTDGGQNWSVVFETVPVINSIDFVDEKVGWAAGEDFNEANGGNGSTFIISTTDGGNNWQSKDVSNLAHGLKSIFFGDRNNGWAVGQGGSIIATSDGGKTWSPQHSGTIAWLYSVYFIDSRNGWAAGACFSYDCGRDYGVVLATKDGGKTWAYQSINALDLRSIYFVNSLEGWTVGPAGSIFHTIDGGSLWEQVPPITSEWINSIYFLDIKHGWACGDNGIILKYGPSS
jgi:serine/threonine protein kinase